MARYVLIEFDNNDEADNFVKMLDPEHNWQMKVPGQTMRVRAVFFKPTQFCDCPNVLDGDGRGPKYGLWVHRKCGKPRPGICQHPRNLLDPLEMPVKYREEYLGIYEPSERGGIRFLRGDPAPRYKERWK